MHWSAILVPFFAFGFQKATGWKPWKINHKFCGYADSEPAARIVHGELINRTAMPWIVRLEMRTANYLYHCAGSIITDRVILTAAHCLSIPNEDILDVTVYFNSTTRDWGPTLLGKKMIIHPQYNSTLIANDVAMLKVNEKIMFQRWFLPVCLPTRNRTYISQFYLIGGWGRTSQSGPSSPELLRAHITLMPQEACQRFLNRTKKRFVNIESLVCGDTRYGDFCKGDSGGPLTGFKDEKHSEQIGIVSSSFGCGNPGVPSMFMRVSYFMPWIKKELRRQACWKRIGSPE